MRFTRSAVAATTIIAATCIVALNSPTTRVAHASSFTDILGPSGSGEFGFDFIVLPNGNFAIADDLYDIPPMTDVGQVTLYNGATHAPISTITGTNTGDMVGSGGFTEVGSTNFVIASPHWKNGAAANAGAATWVDGTAGLNGEVSPLNSIVGTKTDDLVSTGGVRVLEGGHYVVISRLWSTATNSEVGAVTWGNGTFGTAVAVSAANSLVGALDGDMVGFLGVQPLTNGNYAVLSPFWDNTSFHPNAGAVTWGNGVGGSSGVVGTSNSLYGTKLNDNVGANGVKALTNGNYVVASPHWNASLATTRVGAATWQDGTSDVSKGPVGPLNSLVGTTADDEVSGAGVYALSNGHYVVDSPEWDSPADVDAGAVTWGNGGGGTVGSVGTGNSLYGSRALDGVGYYGVVPLTNGNYVVVSPFVDTATLTDAGAVTWVSGAAATSNDVDIDNSLLGATDADRIGIGDAVALANGHYVFTSPDWDGVAAIDAGAATWGNGVTGTFGVVGVGNSLVGTKPNDKVGNDGVAPLAFNNYVVNSSEWGNTGAPGAGAATWRSGNSADASTVELDNSIVGTHAMDGVSGGGTVPLANGNYVVLSPNWGNGVLAKLGAATLGNGGNEIHGAVSATNSLVGVTANDRVGTYGIHAFPDSGYVVISPFYNSGVANGGVVTFGGLSGVSGTPNASNSVFGTVASDVNNASLARATDGSVLIGRPALNKVTLFLVDATPPTFNNPHPPVTAPTAPGATTAVVTFDTPPAVEDVGVPTVVCNPPSGSSFPLGDTLVTCTATNTEGLTATTQFTVTVVPGSDFIPLAPSRIVDTRPAHTTVDGFNAGSGQLELGTTLAVLVAGRGGVPSKSVAAALNVTVTEAVAPGFATVYPCDQPRPTASNLNFDAGSTIPNAVVTKLDATGLVCVFTSQPIQLIVDVNGAFPKETTYNPINPARLLDTRTGQPTVDGQQQGTGAVGPGSITVLQVTGRAGVPADAAAVLLNVTVTEPGGDGYATVYPCGTEPPTASNLNYTSGLTIPNLVVAKLGGGGTVCIYSQMGTHLVADVNGYFPANTTYAALNPARLLDSRPGFATIDGQSSGGGPVNTGTVTTLRVAGRGGVPAGARTAVLNVTVTAAAAAGYVTVYPCGIDPPLASNLNFGAGQTIPNAVITKIGASGDVCLFSSQPAHLIADVNGYFP